MSIREKMVLFWHNHFATELDDLLDMIFAQTDADGVSRVAKYMCRKFYRWFVYYDIDATTEQNVIVALARVMMTNNYEIQPVLDTLFHSANFYDDNNIGCVIKNPIDFIAGTLRQLGITLPPLTDTSYYRPFNDLRSRASNLQMNLLDPPNVAGGGGLLSSPRFPRAVDRHDNTSPSWTVHRSPVHRSFGIDTGSACVCQDDGDAGRPIQAHTRSRRRPVPDPSHAVAEGLPDVQRDGIEADG